MNITAKKHLYESIMKDVAKTVKNVLKDNASDNITTLEDIKNFIDPKHFFKFDDITYIDFTYIKQFKQELFDLIVDKIINTCELVLDSVDDDNVKMYYNIQDIKSDIIFYSLCACGFSLDVDVTVKHHIEHTNGMKSSSYDVPDDPDETEDIIDDIIINKVAVSDGGTDSKSIFREVTDKNTIEVIKEAVEYSEAIREFQEDNIQDYIDYMKY